ncbi:MAG: vanadium-dependent haloperoxidase [Pyrinomonadaceae bacterium]
MKNYLQDRKDIVSDDSPKVSRRKFFGSLGSAAVGAAALGAAAPLVDKRNTVAAQVNGNSFYHRRAAASYQYRLDTAQENFQPIPRRFSRPNNGDEELYPNRIGSYSKGLPHQSNGEVVPSAYDALLDALRTGNPAMFEQIPMGGDRHLTNPQAGLAFDLEGDDCFTMIQRPAPAFASRENAAEIAENYWMALLRDVAFTDYPSSPIANAAAADLSLFGADFKGPKNGSGQVTPNLLFRGLTAGDRTGPYISQFFLQPCFFGANEVSQRINTAVPGVDYMTDFASWLSVQNGVSPASGNVSDPQLRYIRNGRDIGQWVHVDVLFQGYFQAFLAIAGMGVPFDSGNPYNASATQDGFGTFGGPHIATLLCEVSTRALKAVWNQKWFVHRRLRPEVFAARVDRTAHHGAGYPVHSEILTSLATNSRLGGYMPTGNAFLPMAFPEGSPTHPAYGAGHGTVAGACVTILKAWFDESFVIPNPLVPNAAGTSLVPYAGDPLTVGGELNKIASNVAIGRNIAGVHWRSDATESLKLGEAIAIGILRDQRRGYNEPFSGFSLTKFDGTTVTV